MAFDPSQPYEDLGLAPQFDPSQPYEDIGLATPASVPPVKRRSLLSQLGSGISRAAFGEDITEDTPQVAAVRDEFEKLKITNPDFNPRMEGGQMVAISPRKVTEHNQAVDAARDKALKEQFGIEPINPAAESGKLFEKAGKYTKAGLADAAEAAVPLIIGNVPGASPEEPFANVKAVYRSEAPPIEEEIKALPKAARIASGIGFGAAETAPKLLAAAALERIGIPAPIAVGAPFSLTPEGFNLAEGIKMGLFPVVSKLGSTVAEAAVSKLGINLGSEAALAAVKALGSTALALGYVHAISAPDYAKMTPSEREEAILSNTGMILAFEAPKYLGLLKSKVVEDKVNAAIMKELEDRGNLAAALERGTQTIPGAEKILPQLPGEKAIVQPPPPIENAPTPQQSRTPAAQAPVPPEATPPVGKAPAGAVSGEVGKEPSASPIRSDQAKLPKTGQVPEAVQAPSGDDLQQPPPIQPEPVAPREQAKAPEGPVKPEPAPEPPPASESIAPVMQELGRAIVQANLKAGRAKLQRVTNDPAFNRAIGVVPGTGRIRVNPDLLAKDTADLTPDQRAEYLRRVVNEEMVHNAGGLTLVDAWNQIPKNGRPTFADFFNDYYRRIHSEMTLEQVAETVRRYGADIVNDPVHVAAEFIRMKIQDAMEGKRTEEPLSLGMVAHFKALLRRLQEWVKEISGNKQLSGLAREHIKAIKDLLKAAEAPPKEAVKAPRSKTFKLAGQEFEITHIDPDTGEVQVRDGRKFGYQTIPDGVSISVDAGSLKQGEAGGGFEPETLGAAKRKKTADEGKKRVNAADLDFARQIFGRESDLANAEAMLAMGKSDLEGYERELNQRSPGWRSANHAPGFWVEDAKGHRHLVQDKGFVQLFNKWQENVKFTELWSEIVVTLRAAQGESPGEPPTIGAARRGEEEQGSPFFDDDMASAHYLNNQKLGAGDIKAFVDYLTAKNAPKPLLTYFSNLLDRQRIREQLNSLSKTAEAEIYERKMEAMRAARRAGREPFSDPEVLRIRKEADDKVSPLRDLLDDVNKRFGGDEGMGYITSLYDLVDFPGPYPRGEMTNVPDIGKWVNELSAIYQSRHHEPPTLGAARRKRDEGPLLPGMEGGGLALDEARRELERASAKVFFADGKRIPTATDAEYAALGEAQRKHAEASRQARARAESEAKPPVFMAPVGIEEIKAISRQLGQPYSSTYHTLLSAGVSGEIAHWFERTGVEPTLHNLAFALSASKMRDIQLPIIDTNGQIKGFSVTVEGSEYWPKLAGKPAKSTEPPKLRSMEKQGDLLSTQTEDFALTGEKGTDFERLQAQRVAAEAKRKAGEQGTGEFTLGAARRNPEDTVPYGFWISPDGNMREVEPREHKAEAHRILSEIGSPFDQAKGVAENQLQAHGYVRAVFDRPSNTLMVDSPKPLSRAVAQAVRDYAIERDINATYGPDYGQRQEVLHEASDNPNQTFGAARREGEAEDKGPTIEIHGIKHRVRAAAKLDAVAGQSDAIRMFNDAGFQTVVRPDGNIGLADEGWPGQNAEGRKLLEAARNAESTVSEMRRQGAPENDLLARFLDSVRSMGVRMLSERRAGNPTAIDDVGLLNDLIQAGHQPIRQDAQRLAAMNLRTRDFVTRMQYVDTELLGILGDGYGGTIVRKVLERVVKEYQDYFTPEEINNILNANPELQKTLDTLLARAKEERGTRVYRMAQQRLKPKVAATLKALESRAIDQEAVQQIIENAKALGVSEPPSKTKPLTPLQKLILMVTPENQSKIDDSIARAVRQGERNAAREVIVRDGALTEDELALYDERTLKEDAVGPDPTPEQVEEGLKSPKFSHWGKLRDGLLGYSPTTLKLAQDVVKGEFKGTKFGATVRPEDLRIDLAALAKAPEAEVQRVLAAVEARVEAAASGGGPVVAERVRLMVMDEVAGQLAAARQRFLDNFFTPKDRVPATASQRLKALLNAGVAKDARFKSEAVRALVKRVGAAYLDSEQLASLATSTRAEKFQWLNQEAENILALERLRTSDIGEEASTYFEAVIRTQLAERIQAAEERIARNFLKGADATFDNKPATPEARARSHEEAKSKLEGIIRAGGLDTALVESVARKHPVQRFVPKLPDLVRKVFETSVLHRGELGERFAASLVDQLGIDPALADKARAVFEAAFGEKLRAAEARALKQAEKMLTPQERAVAKPGKKLWQKLVQSVNAGVFDDFEVLNRIAGSRVKPEQMAMMKELAELEQSTGSKLTPSAIRELDIQGITAEKLAEYERTRTGLTEAEAELVDGAHRTARRAAHSELTALHTEMVTLWAQMSKPLGIRDAVARRNMVEAANQYAPPNLMFRPTFVFPQAQDILAQAVRHNFTTAMAHASKRLAALPESGLHDWWREYIGAIKDSFGTQFKTLKSGLHAANLALRSGKGLPSRVEGIEVSSHIIERMAKKADELFSKNDPTSTAMAIPLWIAAKVGLAYRFAGSLDVLQSSAIRFPELQAMVKTYLIEHSDMNRAEIEMAVPVIIGDINAEIAYAHSVAPEYLASNGITETPAQLATTAWDIVYSRMLERVRQAGIPDAELQAAIEKRMGTLGWNREEASGIGKLITFGPRQIQALAAKIYLPTGGVTAFATAAATSVVQSLEGTPLGFWPKLFEGSPTVETDLDARQVRAKAAVGMAVGVPLMVVAMMGAGIKVLNDWPDDKEERERWNALGLRPGMILIQLPGMDKAVTWGATTGFTALVLPYLYAGGSIYAARMKHERAQKKENERAAKLGIQPVELPGLGVGDIMTAVLQGFWGALQGSRTVSGKVGAYSDLGKLVTNKSISSYLSAFMPGLPFYQSATQVAGLDIDPRKASVAQIMLPVPGSPARRLNALGDPVTNYGDLNNLITRLTRGTGAIIDEQALMERPAYAALFASGFTVPAIQPNRGYNINGTLRPMNEDELNRYTELRGRYLKQELGAVGGTTDEAVVRKAYQSANARALADVGVTREATGGGGASGGGVSGGFGGGVAAGVGAPARLGSVRAGLGRPVGLTTRASGFPSRRIGVRAGISRGIRGPRRPAIRRAKLGRGIRRASIRGIRRSPRLKV